MEPNDFLPEPLPESPMPLFGQWFADARRLAVQPNPDAMVLATLSASNRPTGRVLLCKRVALDRGYLVFFTNYESAKGGELEKAPSACAVFHWDALHRQVRIEGTVVRCPAEESDQYFATRPFISRIGAWASQQSAPLASRSALAEQVRTVRQRFGFGEETERGHVPRPPHWGGYRLWISSVELWVEGPGRIHDRAIWTREISPNADGEFATGQWQATRLNP